MKDQRISGFIVLLYLFFSIGGPALAQSNVFSIRGEVLSAESREPIPDVNIFLNQTTIGTTSDTKGEFGLSGIPEGLHDLVLSFIGYETVSLTINTDSLKDFYAFEMQKQVVEMEEFIVTYDRAREGNYKVFKDYFLGKTANAEYSKIMNPDAIYFSFDKKSFTLTAEAYKTILVDNNALGYEMNYDLDTFKVDFRNNQNFLAGIPFFKEKTPVDSLQLHSWKRNREISYNGSFQHFIDALLGDSLNSAGFQIRREKQTRNKRIVASNPIKRSAIFFELVPGTYVLQFNEFINVTYLNELEDQRYLNWKYGYKQNDIEPGPQNTSIYLESGTVYIDESGYISDPLKVLMDGYWFYTKVADLMPLNYK